MNKSLAELVEVVELANNVFGDADQAHQWLHKTNVLFGGTPIAYLTKINGKVEVIKVLNAIRYGGVV